MTITATRDVWIKLERARKHIAELGGSIESYEASKPYDLVTEHDATTGEDVVRFRVRSPIPPEWGAIVGDVLHNIRSALDVLAHVLVRAAGATPHEIQTKFPMTRDASSLEENIKLSLKGAAPRTQAIVRWLKPIKGAENPLYLLHELSNTDKHRLLTPVATGLASFTISTADIEGDDDCRETPMENYDGAYDITALFSFGMVFKDGDEVMRYRRSSPDMPLIDGIVEFEFAVTFDRPADVACKPVVPTLDSLASYAERVVCLFESGVRPKMA